MMRQFIRHPVSIPIEIDKSSRLKNGALHALNIGYGGLAFRCQHTIKLGTVIKIKISCIQPAFEADAKVMWCCKQEDGAEIGVEFLNSDDAFMARMVEQICYIETYKNEVNLKENRTLTTEEAAVEWINKYAANFPNAPPNL